MKDEQINIAIAEACGWTDVKGRNLNGWWKEVSGTNPEGRIMATPNYCNDLNAMHEAEVALGLAYDRFQRELKGVCERDRWCIESAPARQRAEAFLRTIGKWEES